MAQFGEILAELRKDHKMLQKELAKIIYVSTGTISNYETGTHFPDVEKLIALADHFTCDHRLFAWPMQAGLFAGYFRYLDRGGKDNRRADPGSAGAAAGEKAAAACPFR